MRRRRFPPYPSRPHGGSGQARIRLPGAPGHTYLGPHGSPASWSEYNRLLTAWRSSDAKPGALAGIPAGAPVRTVADLVARYLVAFEAEADPREVTTTAHALAPLIRLHAHTPIHNFGPKAMRAALVAAASGAWLDDEERERRRRQGDPLSWSRRYANRSLSRWKRAWRWGEAEELIAPGTWHSLQTVTGLKRGQARETEEVPPVPEDALAAALPLLGPIPRAAVELLLLTGARPSELLKLTPAAVNRTGLVEVARGVRVRLGDLWAYQPDAHKTAWRGHRRVILFGPKAQAALAPLLEGRDPAAWLFDAGEIEADRRRRQGAGQRSAAYRRRPPRERRSPRPQGAYTVAALRDACAYACKKAGVEPFSPYQLRHSAATRLVSEFGPEVARILLGHRDLKTTGIYVMEDFAKVAKVVQATG